MQVSYSSCYFSSLEGDIAEVPKLLTFGKLFELVQLRHFQVGIKIYEENWANQETRFSPFILQINMGMFKNNEAFHLYGILCTRLPRFLRIKHS